MPVVATRAASHAGTHGTILVRRLAAHRDADPEGSRAASQRAGVLQPAGCPEVVGPVGMAFAAVAARRLRSLPYAYCALRRRNARRAATARPGQNPRMKHGIIITSGDSRTVAEHAAAAEAAGWDGVFTYDAIAIGEEPLYDPWVTLAAMAMRTHRVTLGAMVFAPARRRPWKLAKEAASIDILSNGRLVLPVGIGAVDDRGFGNVGEPTGAKERAELMDETLAIVEGLGTGEPFAFAGVHYRFGPMALRPTPIQRPRIPVWVVGAWPHPRSMRRAVRWDGIVVQARTGDDEVTDPGNPARPGRVDPSRAPGRAPRSTIRDHRRWRDPARRPRRSGRDRPRPGGGGRHLVDRGGLGRHLRGQAPRSHRCRAADGRLTCAGRPTGTGRPWPTCPAAPRASRAGPRSPSPPGT